MHVNAKKIAFGGLFLALTEICMMLGSVIETNTLFLLAAAAYFVGIVVREFGHGTGVMFYAAGVLLGFFLTPNKFYVCSYAAMALYILSIEYAWEWIGHLSVEKNRMLIFWVVKYVVFNVIYIPLLFAFGSIIISKEMSMFMWIGVLLIGQVALLIYDRAYEYVQTQMWSKIRGRLWK